MQDDRKTFGLPKSRTQSIESLIPGLDHPQTCHDDTSPKRKNTQESQGKSEATLSSTYSSNKNGCSCINTKSTQQKKLKEFSAAVQFAYSQDCPLTIAITISWNALLTAGEHLEGNCLWRGTWEREAYLRKELRRLCRLHSRQFACIWGRDIGRRFGEHVHLAMFWPSAELALLIPVLERITGSRAELLGESYVSNPAARSICGGWQIDLNLRDLEGALGWAEYIVFQHAKHNHLPNIQGKAFGISQAISSSAQRRFRSKN